MKKIELVLGYAAHAFIVGYYISWSLSYHTLPKMLFPLDKLSSGICKATLKSGDYILRMSSIRWLSYLNQSRSLFSFMDHVALYLLMLPPFVSAFLMPFLAPGRPISQRLLLLLQAELMPHKEICRRKAF